MLMLGAFASMGVLVGTVAVTVGGGSTVGVPLLLLSGETTATSIATVKFALVGSFVSGSLAHRRSTPSRTPLPWSVWPLSVAASVAGSLVVVGIDDRLLRFCVGLLMVGVLWLTCRTNFSDTSSKSASPPAAPSAGIVTIVLLCAYSGFFGAGFGTFVIFTLMRFFGMPFSESASVMTRLNLLVVGSSVATFATSGAINYRLGLPMMAGCALGGIFGAWVARAVPGRYLKVVFIVFTLLLCLKLLWEALRT